MLVNLVLSGCAMVQSDNATQHLRGLAAREHRLPLRAALRRVEAERALLGDLDPVELGLGLRLLVAVLLDLEQS